MAAPRTLFSDKIVSATVLNRHSGQVLDSALDKPITITRAEQAFALMSRELCAGLVAEAERAEIILDLVVVTCRGFARGLPLDPTHRFEWISAFDDEDLRTMIDEGLAAFGRARTGEGTWEEFDSVLHEWEESAWAARSPVLREALNSPGEEVPLTPPVLPPSEG